MRKNTPIGVCLSKTEPWILANYIGKKGAFSSFINFALSSGIAIKVSRVFR